MLSGRRLDLLDPSPFDIEIEDIAHGLARVARWNGQTNSRFAFSVAQHSVIVEQIARHLKPDLAVKWQMAALLHDAPEYVIGDMISPFKAMLGDGYRDIETRLEQAVHLRFGLPAQIPKTVHKLIKRADRMCAWFEAGQIAGFSEAEARKWFLTPPVSLQIEIAPLSARKAQAAFLARFAQLHQQAAAKQPTRKDKPA
ncbi:COG1896: Predicted hydrolases of HD superfamily [hydrothermal vent metagenome]|uniref:COG1896: Predicted hydrolases of HD superfamily n=1 Tax=hydrothermal vent metagenome TaxID=652676 RepID=A0A3B0R8T6_9ZZZZ